MHMGLLIPEYIASLTLVSVYAKYAQPMIRGSAKKVISMVQTITGSTKQYAKAEMRLLYSKTFLNGPDMTGRYETNREALEHEIMSRVETLRQSKRGFFGQNCKFYDFNRPRN